MSYRVILESESPIRVVMETTPSPPPIQPPSQPPVPPPQYDDSPFEWPLGGPQRAVDPSERYRWSWQLPGRQADAVDGQMYAYEETAGYPSWIHKNAGIIQGGSLAGLRLWAPFDAPPRYIRQALRGDLVLS